MTTDTNIIIAYLAGEQEIVELLQGWRVRGGLLYLPTIVEAEILSFPKWTAVELVTVKAFLRENFVSVAFDRQIAHLAADLRREYKIKLPDAAIAASAIHKETPLITRDVKDFGKVAKLQLVTP